jgi:hypothetical protein
MVQYHQNRVDSISELERRLEASGYGVGLRVLELLAVRARDYKRETKLMPMLQFVSTVVWKALFGKAADSLERSSTCCCVCQTEVTAWVCVGWRFGCCCVASMIARRGLSLALAVGVTHLTCILLSFLLFVFSSRSCG